MRSPQYTAYFLSTAFSRDRRGIVARLLMTRINLTINEARCGRNPRAIVLATVLGQTPRSMRGGSAGMANSQVWILLVLAASNLGALVIGLQAAVRRNRNDDVMRQLLVEDLINGGSDDARNRRIEVVTEGLRTQRVGLGIGPRISAPGPTRKQREADESLSSTPQTRRILLRSGIQRDVVGWACFVGFIVFCLIETASINLNPILSYLLGIAATLGVAVLNSRTVSQAADGA